MVPFSYCGRAGRIKRIIDIGEPHPRPPAFMLEPRFSEWRNECYASLHDEIRHAISGNLCRCTGYVNIVKAYQYAAQKMREGGA